MSAPSVITVQVNAETAGAVANLEKIIGSVHRLSGLGDFVSGLGARLAAAFTVGAVVKLTENAIRLDDEMGKMAERVGIGVQELSKLAYAAKLADVEAGEFEFGLKSFNKQIAEGSELFQTLGIDLRNADGSLRSTSDILGDVAEKFSGFNAGANKSALAVELFGRAGTRLISFLNGGKKAIQEAGAELEKFGGVTTPEAAQQAQDFNDDITRLQTALHSIFRAFSENILPILKAFTERMIESKERTAGFVGVAQVLTTIVKLLATAFAVTATHILSVGQAIGVLTAINWELLQGKFRSARDMAVSAFDEIQARVLKTKETIEGIWASAKAPKLELPDEKKTEAPSTRGDVASQAKLNQSRLDQELKLQQSFNAIDAVENENRLKWQEQTLTEFYAKKIEMAQDAAAKEQEILFEQIAAAEKLMEASKDDLQKLAEATALRDQLRKESFVIENNLAAETKKLFAEKVEASLAAENEISAARITIAEATGQKLLAEEIKIRKQFADLRQSLKNSIDPTAPGKAQIDAAEKAALNNARLKIQFEEEDRKAQKELLDLSVQRARVESDFTKTDAVKRPQIIALLQREKEIYDEQVTALQKKMDLASAGEREQIQQRLDSLTQRRDQAGGELEREESKPDPNSFGDQFTLRMTSLQEQWGSWAIQAAATFESVFHSAVDSISEGIMGLLNRTQTWGQALQNIGGTILQTLIAGIVKMGVAWVAQEVLRTAAAIAGSYARGAAEKKEGLQAAFTYAVKAAKSAADIPFVGWILAPIVFAAVLASAIAASSLGGFREGGFTGDGSTSDVAGVVHKKEFVMPEEKSWLFPALEKVRTGAWNAKDLGEHFGRGIPRPATSGSDVAERLPGIAGGSGAAPNVNVSSAPAQVRVAVLNSMEETKRWAESEDGQKTIFDPKSRRHLDDGTPT